MAEEETIQPQNEPVEIVLLCNLNHEDVDYKEGDKITVTRLVKDAFVKQGICAE